MDNKVVTVIGRNKLLKARAGIGSISKVVGFAFGNGGMGTDGNVLRPSKNQNTLNSELLRKPITSVSFINDLICRYSCSLEKDELANQGINEIALYDEDGDLVAIKNFATKTKSGNAKLVFQIDDSMEV